MESTPAPRTDQLTVNDYRRLIDAMADGVVVQDASGRVITCNAEAQRILGLNPGDLHGFTPDDLPLRAVREDGSPFPGQEHPAVAALRTGEPQRSVVMGMQKDDGSVTWISVDSVPLIGLDPPTVSGVLSIFHDMTERRRAEALLRAGYEELKDLYNNAPCGYHSLDRDGVYIRVNDTELHWIGRTREEVIGKLRFADVLTPHAARRFNDEYEQFVTDCQARHVELELPQREGTPRHVVAHATAVRDARGGFLCSRTTLHDITDRKAIEEEAQRMNQILEARVEERTAALNEAVRELEGFTSSVSHDLRAPVRAIDGFAKLLEAGHAHQLDEEGRRLLSRLIAANKRQVQLISDLLSLSRVWVAPLTRQQVDATALAQTAFEDLCHGQPRPGLHFTVQPGMTAWADPGLMRIVLDNLLDNAWKFTRPIAQGRIEVGSFASGRGETVYFVRDNGVGFDASNAAGLFEPFKRMHRDSDFPGAGVGLATVQRIVARHGGRIWVESAPGAGATVLFTLEPGRGD